MLVDQFLAPALDQRLDRKDWVRRSGRGLRSRLYEAGLVEVLNSPAVSSGPKRLLHCDKSVLILGEEREEDRFSFFCDSEGCQVHRLSLSLLAVQQFTSDIGRWQTIRPDRLVVAATRLCLRGSVRCTYPRFECQNRTEPAVDAVAAVAPCRPLCWGCHLSGDVQGVVSRCGQTRVGYPERLQDGDRPSAVDACGVDLKPFCQDAWRIVDDPLRGD